MNTYHHSVYFWLRADGDADDAQRTADGCRSYLSDIPGIVRMAICLPAGPSAGPIDGTYGAALLMEFETEAARDSYEVHPDHRRFLADFRHLWSRVVVYDSVPA